MDKTLIQSLFFTTNIQTFVVSLLLDPLISILFLTSFMNRTGSKSLMSLMMLTFMTKIILTFASNFVAAQQKGILKNIFISGSGFCHFVASLTRIASAFSLLQLAFTTSIVLAFGVRFDISQFMLTLAVSWLTAIIFGLLASLLGLLLENPYFFNNVLVGILPIVAAILIPIGSYPLWLRLISQLFPFWLIWQGISWRLLLYLLIFAALTLVVYWIKRKRILATA